MKRIDLCYISDEDCEKGRKLMTNYLSLVSLYNLLDEQQKELKHEVEKDLQLYRNKNHDFWADVSDRYNIPLALDREMFIDNNNVVYVYINS